MNTKVLAWQKSQWDLLQKRKAEGNLPHALMFSGVQGVGKYQFASTFAHSLLCSQNLCQTCKSCKLLQAGYHPDLLIISPEDNKVIKVDNIRAIVDFVNHSPHISSRKVVIINAADKMNLNAANALLKTLEEPNKKITLILVTHQPMSLPATVRSRCQTIKFAVPSRKLALDWLRSKNISSDDAKLLLQFAHGAPLKVVDFVADDLLSLRKEIFQEFCDLLHEKIALPTLSQAWSKLDVAQILFHLTSWVQDIIRIKSATIDALCNTDFAEQLKNFAGKYSTQYLFEFYDKLIAAQKLLQSSCNPNPQLLFEGLLVDLML